MTLFSFTCHKSKKNSETDLIFQIFFSFYLVLKTNEREKNENIKDILKLKLDSTVINDVASFMITQDLMYNVNENGMSIDTYF